MNFLIQKGTELGVQKFIPILSERTSVKDINNERDKKNYYRNQLSSQIEFQFQELNHLKILKDFLFTFPKNGILVFCDINCNQSDFKKILLKKDLGPVCILIGPEGDFSENERKLIVDLEQSQSISLAKNILRAETAALAGAVSLVNYHLNLS